MKNLLLDPFCVVWQRLKGSSTVLFSPDEANTGKSFIRKSRSNMSSY